MNDVNRQPAGAPEPSGERGAQPGEAQPRDTTPASSRPGGWFDTPTATSPAEPSAPAEPPGQEVTEELPAVEDGAPATRVERIEVAPAGAPTTRVLRADGADGAAPPGGPRTRPAPEDGPWAGRPSSGMDVFWPPATPPPAGQGPGLPRTGPPGGEPPLPGRRTLILVGLLTVVVLVAGAVLAGVVLLRGGDDGLGALAGALNGRPETTTTATPPAKVVISPANKQKQVKPDGRIKVVASGGRLTSVKVAAAGGGSVPGKLSKDGGSWQSSGRMIPATRYTVTAKAVNPAGTASTTKSTFTTLTPTARLGTSIMPLNGETVGVGMPIGIFFTAPVADKAAVERRLQVSTAGKVEGAWRWFGDRQIRWRPREFWPAGEKVELRVRLAGVNAGGGVWGMANRVVRFTVGDSHVSTVDVKRHKMTVAVNGKVVKTLPVSTGRKEFPTTNGVHTVLEKNRHKLMDSATIGIPEGDPEHYRLRVEYAVRITNTGEFVHSAPWSEGSQGNANVSHGCVNLSMDNGAWFFALSRRGDVVKVTGSPRQPGETEGLLEWNRSFEAWKAGSAL